MINKLFWKLFSSVTNYFEGNITEKNDNLNHLTHVDGFNHIIWATLVFSLVSVVRKFFTVSKNATTNVTIIWLFSGWILFPLIWKYF